MKNYLIESIGKLKDCIIRKKQVELQDMHTDDPKEFWRRVKMLRPRKPDESSIDFDYISSDTQSTETLKKMER